MKLKQYIFLLLVFVNSWVHAEEPVSAWEKASLSLFKEAAGSIKNDGSRESRYAQGILLLGVQPRTETNIEASQKILMKLIEENSSDDIGVSSRYYLGRIYQVHLTTPDLREAARIYESLIQDRPDHPLVQLAIVKWELLRLFEDSPLKDTARKIAEVESKEGLLKDAGAQVCFHLNLADYIIRYGGSKETALRHLIKAEKTGIQRSVSRGDTYLRVGLISKELGKKELAVEYLQKFITEFERDVRAYAAKKTLEEVKK